MKYLWIALIFAVGITVAAFVIKDDGPQIQSDSPNLLDEPRHPIDEEMLSRSESLVGSIIEDYSLIDEDGNGTSLFGIADERPLLIITTKDECPCSIESQPYFTQLAEAYGDEVAFIAVFDTPPPTIKQYRIDFRIPYTMTTVESGDFFNALKLKQSVYVTLVDSGRRILAQWPGYSAEMLQELDLALSQVSGTELSAIDVTMAPERMTSGCYFEDAIRD